MGSFNMSCSITGTPFMHRDEVVIIPLFIKKDYSRPLDVSTPVSIFPFYVNGKYDDYGDFIIDKSDISNSVLDELKKLLVRFYRPSEEDVDEGNIIKFDKFKWKKFFMLCHDEFETIYGRMSYFAINKKVFDNIINNYKYTGILDDSIDHYDPKNFGLIGIKEFIKAADTERRSIKNTQSKDYLIHQYRFIYRNIAHSYKFDGNDNPITGEMFKNTMTVLFIDLYLSAINTFWKESMYAGQEFDTLAFEILRNSITEVIDE